MKKKPQDTRVRPKRVQDYQSHFHHILAAKIDGVKFGSLYLTSLTHEHLKGLQSYLLTKGLKASSVNAIVHSSLRAMLRDARSDRFMLVDLYNDRALLRPLEIADPDVDPYIPEEREQILEGFRKSRYYAFVYHQFWTGMRPSEACYLKWGKVDLTYGKTRVEGSRVRGHEGRTQTKRSNREIDLHDNLLPVLKAHKPLHVSPDDYVFTTPEGTPIEEERFYRREWLPKLRRLNIRPRPFYNTRHSYTSFMLSVGGKIAFVSKQTGDSIKTLETHYTKYIPQADLGRLAVEDEIRKSETRVKPAIPKEGSSKAESA
jgi:integrase